MNNFTLILFGILVDLSTSFAMASGPVPVENFNLEKYQGSWHQLASIPVSFQKNVFAIRLQSIYCYLMDF
ncbi:MAG: lipocalin family protein [Bdellovibrionaceae bacterium]|nr:lipocalin family protein [Pseudobdellovibrionaceae bacterium]